jgi:arsenite methyltransferase
MTETTDNTASHLRKQVRDRYAAAAVSVTESGGTASCCTAPVETDDRFGSTLYTQLDREDLPVAAVAASLGCGNPTAVADLRPGERVLDLGSGGGIDVLLSANRVGPTGFVYGVDMTEEMLDLARANATQAGATNVRFIKGTIEDVPLPDEAVDVVISNCVINLSVDKPKVIAEMFRVLAPGGRIGVSDVVAEDHVTPNQRAERGSWVGCIAGGLSRGEYLQELADAGFVDASVRFTAQVADGMHNAIVQATKPDSPTVARVAVTRAATEPHTIPTGIQPTHSDPVAAACCDSGTASACCEPSAKTTCCGDTVSVGEPAGLPGNCGCR